MLSCPGVQEGFGKILVCLITGFCVDCSRSLGSVREGSYCTLGGRLGF